MPRALDRRTFLRLTSIAGAGAAFTSLGFARPARAEPLPAPFVHGVASGDPLADRVLLWTRVTPTDDATPGSGRGGRVTVRWIVARDAELREVVRQGTARTGPERDHTVKVDVDGLDPATTYHYAFEWRGERSVVGRTRTAPAVDGTPPDLRFALASCSNLEGGYFAGYRGIAERDDLDFVLHVGDYIYEYRIGYYGAGPDIGREHRPDTDVVTLDEYRQRYACYREDPDLRAVHAAHPFILMWDDHEVADDNWSDGAFNHDEETQGPFEDRFAAATQAYFEWLPIREHAEDPRRLYRRFELGDLATLHMIDSRSYRSEQVGTDALDPGAADPRPDPAVDDPDRTLLGAEQKEWFKRGLTESTARWQLVGNPQMIAPVYFPPLPETLIGQIIDVTGVLPRQGLGYNKDQWDGYRAARDEILAHLDDHAIDNTVFFTGDIHSSWACDLPRDPGAYPLASRSVATELVGTSITSDNLDEIVGSPPRTTSIGVEEAFKLSNRHVKLLEFDSHGYSVVDVNAERVHMDWWYLRSDATPMRPQHDPDAEVVHGQAFRVDVGTNQVTPAEGPVGGRVQQDSEPDAPEQERDPDRPEDDGQPGDDAPVRGDDAHAAPAADEAPRDGGTERAGDEAPQGRGAERAGDEAPRGRGTERATPAAAGGTDERPHPLPVTGATPTAVGAAALAAAEGLRRVRGPAASPAAPPCEREPTSDG